jgi:hypothetical protein
MPWKVIKKGESYKIQNLTTKKVSKKSFKTRKSAMNTKKNYENYYKKKKDK